MKVTCRYEIPKEQYEYTNGDIGKHVANLIVRELCKKIADIVADGGEYILRMTPNDIMENPYTNSMHYQRYVFYEPLIRCKDCKYCWYDDDTDSLECGHNKGLNEEIYGNDFCCYGERREP